ncbi:MAG: BTAD domain-containing putative transcriptional regulator [Alphaproteobacteria bacterium]
MRTDNPPSRDRVMALLWGDRFNEQARQSLRQSISKLRQLLVCDQRCAIWADNDRLGLDPDLVSIDLTQFITLTAKHDPLSDAKAAAIFQTTLLEGLFVRENAFEEWLATERSRVNELAFPVFERLARHHLKEQGQSAAIEVAQRLIALDPLRETSHRLLMRILAQSGQRAAAIKQFNNCAQILMRELNVAPDPETKRVLEEIKTPGAPTVTLDEAPAPDSKPATLPEKKSTKVTLTTLSFQVVGEAPDLNSVATGMTEDITTALTKFRWLDVIAQMPALDGNPSIAGLRQAALDQQVNYSVEGSVRQLGENLRITVQLVELNSGKFVWIHRYDRARAELLVGQDEIIETIAASIESELVSFEGEKARSKSSDTMSAWDCYHLGLATQYEFNTQGNARAQALFRRAIALDPAFAAAYARLSYAMVLSSIYFEADPNSGLLDEALLLARQATRLDDQDALARFALGRTHLARKEYDKSIFELEHAISLNPSLAQAHCGLGDSLAYMGRSEEAIPKFEEAVRLSPHDPHRWAFSMYGALAHIFAGHYERAAEWALAAIRVPNSHYWANAALVSALGHLDRKDEAKHALRELTALKPGFDCAFARERFFFLEDQAQIDRYIDGLAKAGVAAG